MSLVTDLTPDLLAAANAAHSVRNLCARLAADNLVNPASTAERAMDWALQSRAAYLEWHHLMGAAMGDERR